MEFNELSGTEREAAEAFCTGLGCPKRRTEIPIVAGMVGLVGSGKSIVANLLSDKIGGTVIEGDLIRLVLREFKLPYDNVRVIEREAVKRALAQGANAIVDADHATKAKADALQAAAAGAHVVFIRTLMNMDVMFGRAMSEYAEIDRRRAAQFFGGASSDWAGEHKSAVVRVREMARRLPFHYDWSPEEGGRFTPKETLPVPIFATVETTKTPEAAEAVERIAHMLIAL